MQGAQMLSCWALKIPEGLWSASPRECAEKMTPTGTTPVLLRWKQHAWCTEADLQSPEGFLGAAGSIAIIVRQEDNTGQDWAAEVACPTDCQPFNYTCTCTLSISPSFSAPIARHEYMAATHLRSNHCSACFFHQVRKVRFEKRD